VDAPQAPETAAVADGVATARAGDPFGIVDLPAPAGLHPIDVAPAGDRLLVTYGTDSASPRVIIVLDPASGVVLGRFNLLP
jgi:hypothetical protein